MVTRRGLLACLVGVGAVCCLAALVFVGSVEKEDVLVSHAALIRKLRHLLAESAGRAMTGRHQQQVPDSELKSMVLQARRTSLAAAAQVTDAANEAASCHDGGPCATSARGSQLPVLKFIPATGAWDVESMGNPDAIWNHVMSAAKRRDLSQAPEGISDSQLLSRIAHAKAKGASDIQHNGLSDAGGSPKLAVRSKPSRLQALSSVGEQPSSVNRWDLIRRLKALIKQREGQVRHRRSEHNWDADLRQHAQRPHAEAVEHDEDSEEKLQAKANELAQAIRDAEHIKTHGNDDEVEALAMRLSDESALPKLCAHRKLSHTTLAVLLDSSLAGCERQLRERMAQASEALKKRVEHVTYSLPEGSTADSTLPSKEHESVNDGRLGNADGQHAMSIAQRGLDEKKAKLSSDLGVLEDGHDRLKDVLDQQKRRITALSQEARGGSEDGADDDTWAPPVPEDGSVTRQRAAALAAAKASAVRKQMWSPPVPPGLPPGYRGQLLNDGATAVPPMQSDGRP